jgi:hypothetical protein
MSQTVSHPYSRARWLKERAQAMTAVAADMLALAKIYSDEADQILALAMENEEAEAEPVEVMKAPVH